MLKELCRYSPSAGLETASCMSDAMQPDNPATVSDQRQHNISLQHSHVTNKVQGKVRILRIRAGVHITQRSAENSRAFF